MSENRFKSIENESVVRMNDFVECFHNDGWVLLLVVCFIVFLFRWCVDSDIITKRIAPVN